MILGVSDSSTVRGQIARVAIVRDAQNTGSTLGWTDVYDGTNPTGQVKTTNFDSNRFKILYDKIIPLSINGPSAEKIDVTLKVNNRVTYLGTTNAGGSNGPGSIHMLIITDQVANYPNFVYSALMCYTDS